MTHKIFKPSLLFYEKFIKRQKEGITFIIFFFFLITFILSRLWVYLAIKNIIPESLTENIKGVHIHHFAYGIMLNSLVGYLTLTLPRQYFDRWKIRLAIFFGIGLGWTFDEFGMWMRLRDDYWLRVSYDAIVIVSLVFINIVYLGNFWRKILLKISRRTKKSPHK